MYIKFKVELEDITKNTLYTMTKEPFIDGDIVYYYFTNDKDEPCIISRLTNTESGLFEVVE